MCIVVIFFAINMKEILNIFLCINGIPTVLQISKIRPLLYAFINADYPIIPKIAYGYKYSYDSRDYFHEQLFEQFVRNDVTWRSRLIAKAAINYFAMPLPNWLVKCSAVIAQVNAVSVNPGIKFCRLSGISTFLPVPFFPFSSVRLLAALSRLRPFFTISIFKYRHLNPPPRSLLAPHYSK